MLKFKNPLFITFNDYVDDFCLKLLYTEKAIFCCLQNVFLFLMIFEILLFDTR